LPWAKKRHRVSLRVRGDVIQAFKQRYGANWRKAMAEFLDAAVERPWPGSFRPPATRAVDARRELGADLAVALDEPQANEAGGEEQDKGDADNPAD